MSKSNIWSILDFVCLEASIYLMEREFRFDEIAFHISEKCCLRICCLKAEWFHRLREGVPGGFRALRGNLRISNTSKNLLGSNPLLVTIIDHDGICHFETFMFLLVLFLLLHLFYKTNMISQTDRNTQHSPPRLVTWREGGWVPKVQ